MRPLRRLAPLLALALLAGPAAAAPFAGQEKRPTLPLPRVAIPDGPALPPTVITAGGQKLLLAHLADSGLSVRWDAATGTLETNRPGWWLINYPLDQIAELPADAAAREAILARLLGRPSVEGLKNWYLRTPPCAERPAAAEPPAPTGPAPVVPHPAPTLIVDASAPEASGSASPFRSIQAAVRRAQPGDVIQVRPGIYRETIAPTTAGTPENPIVLEGLRSPDGRLPIISGNAAPPADAWRPVPGHPGLWHADHWTPGPGELALDGRVLRERTLLSELADYEFVQLRADRALIEPPANPAAQSPRPGDRALGLTWRHVPTDDEGFLQFGDTRGLFFASSWVWLDPVRGEEWDPRFPAPVTGQIWLGGGFRAGRQTGSPFHQQLNPYRVWVNGEIQPAYGIAGTAKPEPNRRDTGDMWSRLPFREGWNHVVLLLDSTVRPELDHRIRFPLPRGRPATPSQAVAPADRSKPPAADAPRVRYLREWTVLGPFPAETPARGIYLRVPAGENPNQLPLDMGARELLAHLNQPHWIVRGLEFRNGAQTQQKAQVLVEAPGVTIAHCRFVQPEVRALSYYVRSPAFTPESPFVVIRDNWVHSTGALGMGATGSSQHLTADNVNAPTRRGRLLVEHNHIFDNNRNGYERFDESGAMKFFRLTGSIIRHNTFVAGDGPALWLDWEHYNNRLEGNLMLDPIAWAVGVEASPGPNLVANNISIDRRPGGTWFEFALLSWNSARTWTAHNTIDTGRNGNPGGRGIYLGQGNDTGRGHFWEPLPERAGASVNNLVVRTARPVETRHLGPDDGTLVHPASDRRPPPGFGEPAAGKGVKAVRIQTNGEELELLSLVRHDFNGLLRHPGDPRAPGAYRIEPAPADGARMQLEAEFADGTLLRR